MSVYCQYFIQKVLKKFPVEQIHSFVFRVGQKVVEIVPANETSKFSAVDIIIHEDQIRRSPEIISNRISYLSGKIKKSVFGRKTKIRQIEEQRAVEFFEKHHIMGYGGGAVFRGLIYQDEIVAMASFSEPLYMRYENPPYYSSELIRFCAMRNVQVIGGLDKLLKSYIRTYNPEDIITYVDKEWSDGLSLRKIGFDIIDTTDPLCFKVNKRNWQRILLKKPAKKTGEGTYLITNRGNYKLRYLCK